jgi:hypothetical protein
MAKDFATEDPLRCRLRDERLDTWRCHKKSGHDRACSCHNDCGVCDADGWVCSLEPDHTGSHNWEGCVDGLRIGTKSYE